MTLAGRRVLYISYNGMRDPLGQSQVLPYLRGLAKKGVIFTLLSFERPAAFERAGRAECAELKRNLLSEGIEWHWLPYHQKPSLPATVYDVVCGIHWGTRLAKKNRVELVHARSQIAATIALAIKKRLALKLIFDIRGLMGEEYVEAGHWRENSLAYRLTKNMERRQLLGADGLVTLTSRIWSEIADWKAVSGRNMPHEVVPCCADLELFRFSETDRARRRQDLGLGDRFLLVYSGSIGSWYLSDRMTDFFVELLKRQPSAHFLWLTTGDAAIVQRLMQQRGIGPQQYTVRKSLSAQVPSYLSAADLGIAFYKPGFSKLATSPVKVTEYLAVGLPIVINSGIGDSDALIEKEEVGALVNEFKSSEYANAVSSILSLAQNREAIRAKARSVAERLFDLRGVGVERYARLYEQVLADR